MYEKSVDTKAGVVCYYSPVYCMCIHVLSVTETNCQIDQNVYYHNILNSKRTYATSDYSVFQSDVIQFTDGNSWK